MDYKKLTMSLRASRLLRGERPCVVSVPFNGGKIYSPKKGKEMYIMTLTDDNRLYFHYLTKWTKAYDPSKDFRVSLNAITSYTVEDINKTIRQYTLSTEEGLYFPIIVIHHVKGTYETDVNIEKFLSKLRSNGIKEVSLKYEEGTNSKGKRAN